MYCTTIFVVRTTGTASHCTSNLFALIVLAQEEIPSTSNYHQSTASNRHGKAHISEQKYGEIGSQKDIEITIESY